MHTIRANTTRERASLISLYYILWYLNLYSEELRFKAEKPIISMAVKHRPKKTVKKAKPAPKPRKVRENPGYNFLFLLCAIFIAVAIATNFPVFYLLCILSLIAGLGIRNREMKRLK